MSGQEGRQLGTTLPTCIRVPTNRSFFPVLFRFGDRMKKKYSSPLALHVSLSTKCCPLHYLKRNKTIQVGEGFRSSNGCVQGLAVGNFSVGSGILQFHWWEEKMVRQIKVGRDLFVQVDTETTKTIIRRTHTSSYLVIFPVAIALCMNQCRGHICPFYRI